LPELRNQYYLALSSCTKVSLSIQPGFTSRGYDGGFFRSRLP
jgi:hypothetical protein